MSEHGDNWVWQGFFGPADVVNSAKAILDTDPRVGVWVPVQGEQAVLVDTVGSTAMFAIQTRSNIPVDCPVGLIEASPSMVGRLVGA